MSIETSGWANGPLHHLTKGMSSMNEIDQSLHMAMHQDQLDARLPEIKYSITFRICNYACN
jgi:hypothetical protein